MGSGIDAYILHHKYQVKPHSSLWFSACAAATVHRIINLLNQKQSSGWQFLQKVPEAAKLAYATKTKAPITSQKLGSQDFWQIANSDNNF